MIFDKKDYSLSTDLFKFLWRNRRRETTSAERKKKNYFFSFLYPHPLAKEKSENREKNRVCKQAKRIRERGRITIMELFFSKVSYSYFFSDGFHCLVVDPAYPRHAVQKCLNYALHHYFNLKTDIKSQNMQIWIENLVHGMEISILENDAGFWKSFP